MTKEMRVEERVIGDSRYRISQLPFGEARPLLWLGASVLLPSIEALGGARLLGDSGRISLAPLLGLDIGIVGKAAKILFDRATPADFERVDDLFTKRTLVASGGGSSFVQLGNVKEVHWPSRYADYLAWLGMSIEVHFGPFSFGTGEDGSGFQGQSTP